MIRVVVVDDYSMVRQGLSLLFTSTDDVQLVDTGGNGEEAVELCQQHSPDVIVLDYQMPILNGALAAQRIRQQFPTIRILMLTSMADVVNIAQVIALGVDVCLSKDVSGEVIIRTIRHLMNERGYNV